MINKEEYKTAETIKNVEIPTYFEDFCFHECGMGLSRCGILIKRCGLYD